MTWAQAQELISELFGIRKLLARLVELKEVELNGEVSDAVADIDRIVANWHGI